MNARPFSYFDSPSHFIFFFFFLVIMTRSLLLFNFDQGVDVLMMFDTPSNS